MAHEFIKCGCGAGHGPDNFKGCDFYLCICGNDAMADGWETSTQTGVVIEPVDYWQGYYLCNRCLRVVLDGRVVHIAEKRIEMHDVVHDAEQKFWAHIAQTFPEVKTGDLQPWVATTLTRDLQHAVFQWLRLNAKVSA